MKLLVVVTLLLLGLSTSAFAVEKSNLSKSHSLIEEAIKSIEHGNLIMAKSLVNIALIEDSKNKRAKDLKIKIQNLIKKKESKKTKIDLSANTISEGSLN